MAVFAEFVIGSLLAIFFHRLLRYEEAAYVIFGTGVLLSLACYLIREEIAATKKMLSELYRNGSEIGKTLSSINEPACRLKSRELLNEFKKNLYLLERGYLLLNEAEFYLEGAKALGRTSRHVKAVDPLLVGWESRGALLNYYQANLKALARGVRITRIFVIDRRDCLGRTVQIVLSRQCADGIDVRIAFREDLQLSGIGGFKNSLDFAVYNDSVVTDRERGNRQYFGTKTRESGEVEKYLRLFNLIEHHSHRLLSAQDADRWLKELATLA